MRDVLPLSEYEATARSLGVRTGVVTGLLWGIPMTGYLMFARGALAVGTALAIGVAGSLMFGCIATLGMRAAATKMMRRVYANDPKLFSELPGGYDLRLPASLMRGPIAVGGVLLLGESSAHFFPHRRNVKQHQASTQIRLDSPVEVEVVERRPGLLGQLFRPGPVQLLKLGNGDDAMLLLVPTPETVAVSIREYVSALRDAAKNAE